MLTIGGLVFLLICVFGSYLVSGGSIEPLVEALPFEMWTIGGAAIGAFFMANSLHGVKHTLGGLGKTIKGAVYKKADYVELLSLMYFLVRLASTKGNMAVEPHIEKRKPPMQAQAGEHALEKLRAPRHGVGCRGPAGHAGLRRTGGV